MATSRSSKSKSSGLRILWIPGGRKGHPKGRFDATNKQVTHLSRQKKSEVWSLGGSKTQKDLIKSESDTAILDGPSVSGLRPLTCTVSAVGLTQCATVVEIGEPIKPSFPPATPIATTGETTINTPLTPDSTTSTAPLISPPNSPEPADIDLATATNITEVMPAKTATPVIITTTATAEIIEENRFSILAKDTSDEIDAYDLPEPSKDDLNARESLLNTSAGTTNSTATTPTPSPAISPRSGGKVNKNSTATPNKKLQNNNYNNNQQGDVNSIESISYNAKITDLEVEWNDEALDRSHKRKKKNKKKASRAKKLDQLDGVLQSKSNTLEIPTPTEEDEKVVKCLYYTLMCCDCIIS